MDHEAESIKKAVYKSPTELQETLTIIMNNCDISNKKRIKNNYSVFAISLNGLTSLTSTFISPKKFFIVSSSGASIIKYPL